MDINNMCFVAVKNDDCINCGFCIYEVECPQNSTGVCIGCGACIKGCPQKAISLELRQGACSSVQCTVNGQIVNVKGPISVLNVIRELRKEGKLDDGGVGGNDFEVCETGGCWNCAVLIDGELTRSCVTPLKEGMNIVTSHATVQPSEVKRIVTLKRPYPHYNPSIFTHGCNYSCDFCHNWDITFASVGHAMTPHEVIQGLDLKQKGDSMIGISGGEPTLNRRWLIETVRELRKKAPGTHIHIDTNASLLSPDYIDELVESGITHITPDIKALNIKTFMKLCGIKSEEKARQYLETSWEAVRYLYSKKISMAVSFPYYPHIHTLEEMEDMARALAAISKDIPVTLIEYQPAFRLRDMPFISKDDIKAALKAVKYAGLHKVVVQGGPGIPLATDPLDLAMCSEDF